MDIFRTARQNFLRRQQESEDADLERQQAREQTRAEPEIQPSPHPEMEERSPGSSVLRRFADLHRPSMPSFMSRRSSRQPPPRPSSSHYDDEIESPKTPRFSLGMPNLSSTRLHLPNLTRTSTESSNGPESHQGTPRSQPGSRSQSRLGVGSMPEVLADERVAEPVPAVPAEHIHGRSGTRGGRRRFNGADPAELHLANMVDDGRRRRRRGHSGSGSGSSNNSSDRHRHRHRDRGDGRRSRRQQDGRSRDHPRRFLFCFPWVRSRRMRTQILRCCVSGIFLALLLSVCEFNGFYRR